MSNARALFTAAVCCLCLTMAGTAFAAHQETVSLAGKTGAVTVPKNPSRVVVMDFGMLDTLDALAAMGALKSDIRLALPKSNLPSYLTKYAGEEYTDVGGLKDFNLETIHAFKPDLIIISGRQQDMRNKLVAIAPVWQVDSLPANYFDGVMRNIRDMGVIFSAEREVEEALAGIQESARRVRETAETRNLKALILLTNDGKISAYGSGSRFGLIHDTLGLLQADPAIKVGIHGQMVNYEYIAAKNPEAIFVVDRSVAVTGKADGVRLLDNDLVNGTAAARNGRIIPLDPNIWYLSGGGLESLRMMIDEIAKALER